MVWSLSVSSPFMVAEKEIHVKLKDLGIAIGITKCDKYWTNVNHFVCHSLFVLPGNNESG